MRLIIYDRPQRKDSLNPRHSIFSGGMRTETENSYVNVRCRKHSLPVHIYLLSPNLISLFRYITSRKQFDISAPLDTCVATSLCTFLSLVMLAPM